MQAKGLAFFDALREEKSEQAFDQEGLSFAQDEGDIFTPALRLWAFLSQVLFKDEQRSCLAAVSRVIVLLVTLGRKPCAKNSGAYCRERAKLSETVIQQLTVDVARGCKRESPRS